MTSVFTDTLPVYPMTCCGAMRGVWLNRPPSIGARIKEPLRTIESAYFLRYCLLIGTDRLLLMVRQRVSDLWRHATTDANRVLIHWA